MTSDERAAAACPTQEELVHLLEDETVGDRERLESHVTDCPACQDRLDTLVDGPALEGALRSFGEPPRTRVVESIVGYDVVREIQRGGQGVVYEAIQASTGRRVALKLLHEDDAPSERRRQRFEREFELVRALEHPNIVRLYDSGTSGTVRYLVMEYIEGRHLHQWLKAEKPAQDVRLRVFIRIARAVQHAHHRGVMHRDLKPANILVDADGQPHVLDLGMAKALVPESPESFRTETGEFAGTLPYASPEQLEGDSRRIDTRTDVYSLGVLLYQIVTDVYPYAASRAPGELIKAIAHEEPRPPSEITAGLDRDLDSIVATAMAKDVDRRYASAESLARDVERHLAGDPIEARSTSHWYVLTRALRRHRAMFVAATVLAVVLVAATITSLAFWRSAVEERDRAREENQRRVELSDMLRLGELIHDEGHLWPVGPELTPECETWLSELGELVARAPIHLAAHRSLRERAVPYGDRDARRGYPEEFDERARLLAHVKRLKRRAGGPSAKRIAAYQRRIDHLDELMAERIAWSYESRGDERLEQTFAALAALLEDAERVRADVVRRRDASRGFRSRWRAAGAEAWSRARADIARLPVYRGLELEPILGLVPLRRHPRTGLWEFWHMASGTRPQWNEEEETWSVGRETGLVFVLVPGSGEPDATTPGIPHQAVRPFFMSKYLFTHDQWARVHTEFEFDEERPAAVALDLPPETAEDLLGRLAVSLPSHDEFEYALEADPLTPVTGGGLRDARGPRPVTELPPNALGLHGLHLRLGEVCLMWDDESPGSSPHLVWAAAEPATEPTPSETEAEETGPVVRPVLRVPAP